MGMDALRRSDYEAAQLAAQEGLDHTPDSAELHLLMARALVGQGGWLEAAHHAELALAGENLPPDLTGIAHQTAREAFLGLDRLVDAALHGVAANNLGAAPNDERLRTLVSLGADRAMSETKPVEALRLLRSLHRLFGESGQPFEATELDQRILDAGEAAASQLDRQGDPSAAMALLTELAGAYPSAGRILLSLGRLQLTMGYVDQAHATFEAFLSGPGSMSRAERLEQIARVAWDVHQWEMAILTFEEAIDADPDRTSAYTGLAEVYFDTSRTPEGLATLDRLMERGTGLPPDELARASQEAYRTAIRADQPQAAISYLERGFERAPVIELASALAEFHLRRNEMALADEVMREFVDRSPDPAQPATQVGDWYYERRMTAVAIHYYREALSRSPRSDELYLKLGEAYAALGWTYDLVTTMEAWVRMSDSPDRTRDQAAELLERHQQWRDAAGLLEPLYAAQPTRELGWRLARAYHHAGEPQRELDVYENLVTAATDRGAVLLDVSRVYLDRGAYREAIPWLERAAQADASLQEVHFLLGCSHQMLEEFEGMWAAWEVYAAGASDPMEAWRRVLDELDERRFWPQAVEILERMLALDGSRDDLRLQRAERLILSGDPVRIQQGYIDYVMGAADPSQAAQSAMWSLARLRRQDLAGPIIEELNTRLPELVGIELATARLYLDLARGAAAGRDLDLEQTYLASARHELQRFLTRPQADEGRLVQAAGIMANAGFFDLAAEAYDQARLLGTPIEPFRREYAFALIRAGRDIPRAMALLDEEIRLDSHPVELALRSVEILYQQAEVDRAISLASQTLDRATRDEDRLRAYQVLANLLIEDARPVELVSASNRVVERSRDQLAALRTSATALTGMGLFDQARARLDLALTLAGEQTDLIEALGRLDVLSGDIDAAFGRFERLAARSSNPWRTWWSYAQYFEGQGMFDLALTAIVRAIDAGGQTPELLVDWGRLEAYMAHDETAVEAFNRALDQVERQPRSLARRRHLFQQILETFERVGRHDRVEHYLDWALADEYLRPDYLLYGAELAFRQGSLDRGRQLIRSYLDEGGALEPVMDLEVRQDIAAESAHSLSRLSVESNTEETARILENHFETVAGQARPEALVLWVDRLREHGVDVSTLQRQLAIRLASQGQAGRAAQLLSGQLAGDPVDVTTLASLYALTGLAGPESAAWTLLDELARREPEAAVEAIRETLALAGVVGRDAAAGHSLALYSLQTAPLPFALARLDWLLGHGETAEAVDLLDTIWAREPLFGSDSMDVAGSLDASRLAIETFGRQGYTAEAMELVEREVQDNGLADERHVLAIRYAVELGDNARARELIQGYRQACVDHPPSLLALGHALADLGAVEAVLELLQPLLTGTSLPFSREALQVAVHAALVGGRPDLAEQAIEQVSGRAQGRHRQHLFRAESQEAIGLWGPAAQQYSEAFQLLPALGVGLADAIRNLAVAGQAEEIPPLLDTPAGRSLSRHELLMALDQVFALPLEPSIEIALKERALAMDPGSFMRRADLLQAYLAQGEDDRSRALLQELDQEALEDPIDRHVLLRALTPIEHQVAVDYAVTVIERPDMDFRSRALAAELLARSGDIERVVPILRQAIETSTAPATEAVDLAEAACRWERYDLCEEMAGRAIEARPDGHAPYALRAVARLHRDDIEGASRDLEHYRATAPEASSGVEQVARASLARGQLPLARDLLSQMAASLDIHQGRVILSGLANALQACVDADQAEAGMSFVEEHYPALRSFPAVLGDPRSLALLVLDREGVQAAIEVYRRALVQRPLDRTLLGSFARFLAENTDRLDEASRLCYRAFALEHAYTPDLLSTLSRIHFRQGNRPRAEQELRAAMLLVETDHPRDAATRAALLRQYREVTSPDSP